MPKIETFSFAVFIGRFQPLHAGHLQTIREALKCADHLIIVVGSAYASRSLRNPWTSAERVQLIEDSLTSAEHRKVHFLAVPDLFYDEARWTRHVYFEVAQMTKGAPTVLIGHNKDDSSFYLKNFPQWKLKETGNFHDVNSTFIRQQYFANKDVGLAGEMWQDPQLIPVTTHRFLKRFQVLPAYRQLVKDQAAALTSDLPPPYTLLMWSAHRDFVLMERRPRRNGIRPLGLLEFASLEEQDQALQRLWSSVPVDDRPPLPPKINTFMADHPHRYPTSQRAPTCVSIYQCPDDDRVAPLLRARSQDLAWFSVDDIVCRPERCFADHAALIAHLRTFS